MLHIGKFLVNFQKHTPINRMKLIWKKFTKYLCQAVDKKLFCHPEKDPEPIEKMRFFER